jgi:hypothetical protein
MSVAEGAARASSTKIAWWLALWQAILWSWLAPQLDATMVPAATATGAKIDFTQLGKLTSSEPGQEQEQEPQEEER